MELVVAGLTYGMASGGPVPLAWMRREQLGRRARSVGNVGLPPGLNWLSFETEYDLLSVNALRPVPNLDLACTHAGLQMHISTETFGPARVRTGDLRFRVASR